jgi:CheY-like chemotaxis protein
LPLSTVVPAMVPEPRAVDLETAPLEPGRRTVLVVEDDDEAAELFRVLLEAEGFGVIRAASVAEALALAPLQPLDLITLEVELPESGGWEFLARIRETKALAHVPVVIIASVVDSHMALTGGAAAILQKPISRALLKASLANLGLYEPQQHTRTVLVVDDDPKAVEVIAALLPTPAYAVVRAYGGSEAITLAQRVGPDLILLDLMMPDVNGFDVVDALQRNVETARIPVIVVTAKDITELDRVALDRDPNRRIHVVEKSGFNRQGFLEEVRRALTVHDVRVVDGHSIDR